MASWTVIITTLFEFVYLSGCNHNNWQPKNCPCLHP